MADDGPGVLRELWHGVTEGAFDHFFTTGFDAFGVIMFFAVVRCPAAALCSTSAETSWL